MVRYTVKSCQVRTEQVGERRRIVEETASNMKAVLPRVSFLLDERRLVTSVTTGLPDTEGRRRGVCGLGAEQGPWGQGLLGDGGSGAGVMELGRTRAGEGGGFTRLELGLEAQIGSVTVRRF